MGGGGGEELVVGVEAGGVEFHDWRVWNVGSFPPAPSRLIV